jgi:membrane fusion protein, multidrug efflux system
VKRQAAALLGAAALAAGCGARDGADPAPKAIHVRVAAAVRHDFTVRAHVAGRLVPTVDRQASVSAPVGGRVQEVTAREGQRVKRGDVLARVDARQLEDAERSAEAALKRTEADLALKRGVANRSRELYEKGVIARQEADSDASAAVAAESAKVEATANLATARRNRGYAEIVAPFDGVVVRVLRHPGEQVDGTAATPIVEVAGLQPLEVIADAPSEILARLHAGDEAEVILGSGEKLPARVASVSGALDAASVVGGVRLAFAGVSPALAIGSPVDVTLAVEHLKDALAVPKRAVRRGAEGGAEVVAVVDGKAKAIPVVTGPEDGDVIAIRSGLNPGDVVVVEDPLGLPDGTRLEIAR